MSADLTTRYLGLRLASPLIASSSPLTGTLESLAKLEQAGAAAVVLPSLFEEQIEHEVLSVEQLHDFQAESSAESLNFFPRLKSLNTGPDVNLMLLKRARAELSIPVIASLNGTSLGGWTDYAKLIEDAGAHALELNIYKVPIDPSINSAAVEYQYCELVAEVRAAVSIPLSVKIGPFFTSLPHFARQLVDAGADGLVLFNRYLAPDIDLESMEFRPDLVLSRRDELRLTLRWIAILRDQVHVSLASTSGVHEVTDVIKALMVGADAVMLASCLLERGPNHLRELSSGLEDWFSKQAYDSVEQIRGSMSRSNSPNPAGLERANYMQALASYTSSNRRT